jgi:hypothetical protein
MSLVEASTKCNASSSHDAASVVGASLRAQPQGEIH